MARRTDGPSAQAQFPAPGGVCASFPGLPASRKLDRGLFTVKLLPVFAACFGPSSRSPSSRARCSRSAGLRRRQTHGRARRTRPDWRQAEHRSVAGQGKVRVSPACAPFKVVLSDLREEGTGNPLQYSCLGNSMDGGPWWATVHGVAEGRTRLNDLTFFL